MISLLYAAEGAPARTPSTGVMNFFPIIVIFGIFYFLIIRPQQKKAKEHQNLLNNLKRGDRILTSGGIYGTISVLKGKAVEIKIADNVKIHISRSSISGLVQEDPGSVDGQKITEAELVKK